MKVKKFEDRFSRFHTIQYNERERRAAKTKIDEKEYPRYEKV